VKTENQILVGTFDGFSWIRCVGKGSFLLSPLMKQFGEERIQAGEKLLAIDLGGCTGMDSTFMGSLAGMAARLAAGGGALEIADIDNRGRQSLEDLGLDSMMTLCPPGAPWIGRIDAIRAELAPPRAAATLPHVRDRARHVLEAHETLADTNPENAKRFAGVISILRDDVADKEKPEPE
jgi:anti-anti-sigma regulatory factor